MNSNNTLNKFDQQCSNRANIYRILADCFRYPEPELKGVLGPLSGVLVSYDKTLEANAVILMEYLEPKNRMESLQVEYSKLFIGPYHLDAPPYGSVYMDKQALVMGEFTQQAIEFYVQAGLDPSDENKEPPDHISTELEFMYFLLFQKVMKKNDHFYILGNSFLEKHLSLWVYPFTQRIAESTDNIFYLKLSKLLDDFIRIEKQYLKLNRPFD